MQSAIRPETWDNLSEESRSCAELSERERHAAKDAFLHLKTIFGARFFQVAHAQGHPLLSKFRNHASHVKLWATAFSENLRRLECQQGFRSLVARIKKPIKYQEAMAILDCASRFSRAGFDILLEPTIDVRGVPKCPDLFVSTKEGQERFYIEISDQHRSDRERVASTAFESLAGSFGRLIPGFHRAGHLLRIPAHNEIGAFRNELERVAHIALVKNCFASSRIDGTLLVAYAPVEKGIEIAKWASANGLQLNSFAGPSWDPNDPHRINLKVNAEQRQLPDGFPSAIVINLNTVSISMLTQSAVRQLIDSACHELRRSRHVAYLVITSCWRGSHPTGQFIIEEGDHILRTDADGLSWSIIFIRNPWATKRLSSDTERAVISAFKS